MTATQWMRVRDLFERALELQSSDDLQAWLDAEIGDDAFLRGEVLSLLDHHSKAGAFLSQPATIFPEGLEVPALHPGSVIGGYTIVREAGHGGMGRVYVARDQRLNRTVALKALRARVTDAARRDRLRAEARAAAALSHPGICTVYALEELDGELFMVSEFIEGRTLRQEIAEGRPPSVESVVQTAQALAAALGRAHDAGVTHGDFKPDNVMRTYDGHLKILDFGLARVESEAVTGLADGGGHLALAGTPGYMAPEQLNGRPRDARSDVFAYGVVVYEFACGRHPFDGPAAARLTRVLEADAAPIAALRPDLPADLVETIERCLRKSSADRFQSAAEIARALARPPAPGAAASRWWRTHQAIVMALYAVASIAAWRIKEMNGAAATTLFLGVGLIATIGAIFRGHLLFTERVGGAGFSAERRRAEPVTLATDVAIGLALTIDGALMVPASPLAAVLTIGLGISLVLTRLIVEPSTAAAAFGAR